MTALSAEAGDTAQTALFDRYSSEPKAWSTKLDGRVCFPARSTWV